MSRSDQFRQRLVTGPPVLLDGPTGTELQRRRVDTAGPGWTAAAIESAPDLLLQIHRQYVAAGAELLTANTFRLHPRNVAGMASSSRGVTARELARDWSRGAIALARKAADGADQAVWIAGSQAPLGDCYEPNQTPDDTALEREHRVMSEQLAEAGADVLLVETQPTLREALAATKAALSTGLPVMTSLVCSPECQLLSGESLETAARQLGVLPIAALGVNCILADTAIHAVETLRRVTPHLPVSVYANVGWFTADRGWRDSTSTNPQVYAEHAANWLTAGARLVGSCCGTNVDHIRALHRLMQRAPATVRAVQPSETTPPK